MTPSSHRLLETIAPLLEEVSRVDILPRFHGITGNAVSEKTSAFDVVSEADEAAEKFISDRLRASFPAATIIGEELVAKSPAALDLLSEADLAFVIDPIDGTKNFTSGLPLFGTMIAVVAKGEVVFGAIHDPIGNSTAFAARGEGAWADSVYCGRRQLQVSGGKPVQAMQGAISTNFLPASLKPVVLRNLPKLDLTFWTRCCAHEYRLAAAGHCDLLLYSKVMPWDHCAGWLLHREAGGFGAHFDGSPYRPSDKSGGLIYAPDEDSWWSARTALFEEAA